VRIRSEQLGALSQAASESFESRMAAHLRKYFPADCAQMGDEGLHDTIRQGIGRAADHGISTEYDVARFIDLMFILCRDFDTNPNTPWAADTLADEALGPSEKMDRLYARTQRELRTLADRQDSWA